MAKSLSVAACANHFFHAAIKFKSPSSISWQYFKTEATNSIGINLLNGLFSKKVGDMVGIITNNANTFASSQKRTIYFAPRPKSAMVNAKTEVIEQCKIKPKCPTGTDSKSDPCKKDDTPKPDPCKRKKKDPCPKADPCPKPDPCAPPKPNPCPPPDPCPQPKKC